MAIIATPLFTSLYLCLLLLLPTPGQRIVVNDSMTALSALAAFLGLGFGAYWTKRYLPRANTSWILLTCGGFCAAIAGIVNFALEVVLRRYTSPSLADAFLLSVYPFLFTGILWFPSEPISLQDKFKLAVDCAIIFFASTLILGATVIQSTLAAGKYDILGLGVALAYPVGDMILVGALFILLIRQTLIQPRQPLWAIFIAGLIIVIGDLLALQPQAQAINPSASWLYIFNLTTPLALMFAGLTQAVNVANPDPEQAPAQKSGLNIPYALRLGSPYLLLSLMYYVLWSEGIKESILPRSCMFAWGGIVLGLIILRQVIAIQENRRLTQDLNQLNSELEVRVQQRTSELVRTNRDLRQEMEQRIRVERALRERDQIMEYNATHDTLTGLANRMLFQTCLEQNITRAQNDPLFRYGILYLDLDAFKIINDSLGHPAGDQVLIDIARRIQSTLHAGDRAARLGGDEFAVILDDLNITEDPCTAAETLLSELVKPFEIAGHRIYLTASIGVISCDSSCRAATDVMRDADLAMYEAKARGKARCVAFDPRLRKTALDRLVLGSDLRVALERNEFCLEYQPIKSLITGRLTGFEAYIRWFHPERGLVAPEDFLPVAETSGLIDAITAWVLQEACSQTRAWQKEFSSIGDLAINVNISPRVFSSPDVPGMIDRVLADTGLAPTCLHLDMTESAFLDGSVSIRKVLEACHARGIHIQMDDFGMNFSSLAYLRRYPIDTLKVVQPFVQRIQKQGDQGEIVRTIISLARELNLEVIAGGVETAEQLAFLKESGCQYAQGFYISPPLDPQKAWILLATESLEPSRV